jgi:hypothetical protein
MAYINPAQLEQPEQQIEKNTWAINVPNQTIVFSTKYKLRLVPALELLRQLKVNEEDFLFRRVLQLPTDPLRLPLHTACCVNKHHNNINEDIECFENMISTLEKSTTELKRLIYLEEFKQ